MMTVAFEVKATFYFLKYSPVSHPIKLNNIMYKTKRIYCHLYKKFAFITDNYILLHFIFYF